MKIKTSELIGAALDWAVAKCEQSLKNKPERCFDCKHHEERSGQAWSEHYCHHPKHPDGHWYSDDVRFSTDYDTHPQCPLPYPEPYSTDWADGGPIVEKEEITIKHVIPNMKDSIWQAHPSLSAKGAGGRWGIGPTPLIAAMRCFVASKLGDEVEIPKELI